MMRLSGLKPLGSVLIVISLAVSLAAFFLSSRRRRDIRDHEGP